jgi:hypothetical protein
MSQLKKTQTLLRLSLTNLKQFHKKLYICIA